MCLPLCTLAADDSSWDSLLKQYVNSESRVDYARWKLDGTAPLDSYLQVLARTWDPDMSAAAQKATLINAYNALTISWILRNYPVESIWRTQHPFTEVRHTVAGKKVSLDAIETRLRNMGDVRIHGALVCGARSCPPLRREAYTGDSVDAQLNNNVTNWLRDPNLNQLSPYEHRAVVSMIFKWYRADFETSGSSVAKFLSLFVPGEYKTIQYNPYHWGLNDTSDLGKDYTNFNFLRDKVRNSF